jgi:release factor glutamine methyltransferase
VRAARNMRTAAAAKKVKVLEALRLAEGYLAKYGIESARLSAEHLLARRMGCSRLDLYLRFDHEIGDEVLSSYRDDLKRRASHYPLQYLLGETEFLSLAFRVREGVFIPRPETELLVEWIEEILGARADVAFVEFGVGSGVISGSLAARHAGWRGWAIDRSAEAVSLARENLAALGVGERVAVFVAEDLGAISGAKAFDLLVANPPYIATGDIASLEEEVSRFEARAAIDGGSGGVDFFPVLAREAVRLLKPGGLAAFEIGHGQGDTVREVCAGAGLETVSMRKDYNGLERMVASFAPEGRDARHG